MIANIINSVLRPRRASYIDALPAPIREEVLAAMEATSLTDIR